MYLQAEEHEAFQARGDLFITLCWFANWPLYIEDKERPKKETATPDWQEAGLTGKGNLQ